MRTSDDINSGTPISYAVNGPGGDNALTLSDYSNFELTINNVSVSLDFGANDGEWHHVAITWASSSGAWFAYLDGKEVKRWVLSRKDFFLSFLLIYWRQKDGN